MTQCYIAFGSNLHQPIDQVMYALSAYANHPDFKFRSVSSLYSSPPLGWVQQPHFINCVASFDTPLDPLQVLDTCQTLEGKMGRVKQGGHRWGPRVIDLDILLYEQKIIRNERLNVPHPGLTKRDFVLFPLLEIAPNLTLPDGSSLIVHCSRCQNQLELVMRRGEVLEYVERQKDKATDCV